MEKIKVKLLILIFLFLIINNLFLPSPLISKEDYQLGPGDVIILTIFAGGKVQNESILTVSSQGLVSTPFLGEVRAEELTIDELSQKIREDLARDYFVNPVVNISIKDYRSKKAYILGEVKKPGLYEIKGEMTLLSLISEAGGINSDKAANYAFLLRNQAEKVKDCPIEQLVGKGKGERIDLKKLLSGDLDANLKIRNSDLVYIPSKEGESISLSKVYVLGRVKNPKAYDFQEGLTALNACILAGGFDPFAAPNRATITRKKEGKKEIIKVNLEKVRDGKEPDVLLKPGDRIYIPESRF
jgi:polysaccharide export outer membrane protein